VFIVLSFSIFLLYSPIEIFEDPSSLKQRLKLAEKEAVARSKNPRIILMGSSRMAFSVIPDLLDSELGLPKVSTLNLGFPGQGIAFYEGIFQLHPELFTKNQVIIQMIDDWNFGENKEDPFSFDFPTETFEHLTKKVFLKIFPNLLERLGWLKTHIIKKLGLRTKDVFIWKFEWSVGDDGLWITEGGGTNDLMTNPKRQKDKESFIRTTVDLNYISPQYCQKCEQIYEKFFQKIKLTGATVVLIHMPFHPEFLSEILQRGRSYYDKYHNGFMSIATRVGVPGFFFEASDRAMITGNMYADPIHLNRVGAVSFTKFLAELIKKEKLLKPPIVD
jgi:hypothetical protein